MKSNRRDFLKGTAWMGAAAVAAGCMSDGLRLSSGGAPMKGFSVPALKKIRVGVVGLGWRGGAAVKRVSKVPGVEVVALCDVIQERIDESQENLQKEGRRPARAYCGKEAYKALCDSDLDVVYIATSWQMHTTVALYAMEHGKHAFIEVPSATTLDECWALVETAERTRRHCMQLENCCYGEAELLCHNLCKKGLIGELVHGEGAYIHDLRELCYCDWANKHTNKLDEGYADYWRLRYNKEHKGNQYETHGLGPIAKCMDINRGDRFDYLVSLESDQYNFEAFAKARHAGHEWKDKVKIEMGDMNTTLIKTVKGRSIMVQHDVSSPRPYSRINRVTGTKGAFEGFQFFDETDPYAHPDRSGCFCRFGWEASPGARMHTYFDMEKMEKLRLEHAHPLWKRAGELAKKVGGHGGMDLLMDLRWAYCLQNGLPLDTDVYDLASWCSLGELTERSVRSGSMPQKVPDFTRGAWKTARPFEIVDVDFAKMGREA